MLEGCLEQFPFVIHEFHSDNGSEFINQVVAKLLNSLLIEQSKSRSRRTNDNALVEGKNGAVHAEIVLGRSLDVLVPGQLFDERDVRAIMQQVGAVRVP